MRQIESIFTRLIKNNKIAGLLCVWDIAYPAQTSVSWNTFTIIVITKNIYNIKYLGYISFFTKNNIMIRKSRSCPNPTT